LPERIHWTKDKETVFEKIETKLHHPPAPPLRERVSTALYKLKVQNTKLERAGDNMQTRDKELFDRCVKATVAKDNPRAAMYANEIAEIRKVARIIIRSQLALEQVALRLETVEELGDMMVTIMPVTSVVRALKNDLAGIIPEVASELSGINEILDSVVIEAGEVTGSSIDMKASSEEAQRVLNEANAVAEQRMKEQFPALPAGLAIPGTEALRTGT